MNEMANGSHKATRKEWIGLGVLTLPTILIALDMNVLHLAVPRLSADLQPTSSQLLWILDIYGFLIAGFLVTMGTLGDRIGRRKVLLTGAAAFGLASLVAAYSTSAEMLIVARALLGVAGATLMPSTMSLIRNMFTNDAERTRALSVWITGFMVGSAIGPLVGGALLQYFWWGSVFLLGVPVMVLLLAVGPVLLPEYRDPNAGRMDLASVGLSLAAVLPVIYGIKEIATAGVNGVAVATIVAGLTFGVIFVRRQGRLTDPMIDLRLFGRRAFSVSIGTLMLGIVAMAGIMYFVAQYLQLVLSLSPLEAGLWTLPQVLTMTISTQLAPRITSKYRPSVVLSGSMALAVAGLLVLAQGTLATIVTGFVIMSIGFGPWLLLATDLIIGTAPPERAGAASAVSETGQEFGFAFGLAALGSIGAAIYRSSLDGSLPAGLPAETVAAAKDSLAGALSVATELPGRVGAEVATVAREAFTTGLQITAAIAMVLIAVGAVVAGTLMRDLPAPSESTPEDEAGGAGEIGGAGEPEAEPELVQV